MSNVYYRHTSYCTSQILSFLQTEGLWQTNVEPVYQCQCCFFNSICSFLVCVIHFCNCDNIQTFHNNYIWIVIPDVIVLQCHRSYPYKIENFIDKCVYSASQPTSHYSVSFSLRPSYFLSQSIIEFRPISPTNAS